MDTDPPKWEKSCEAARQLRQDLVDGYIDVRTYKPKTVHTMRNPLFTQYPLHRFTNNLRNIVSDYQASKIEKCLLLVVSVYNEKQFKL